MRLRDFYARGARFLYVSGGEPYLWRDGRRRLSDVIELARDTGYLRTQVYTNGTVPLTARPDLTWVSIDGLAETYRTIRGISCDRVLHNVSAYDGKCAIVFTVNTINRLEIRAFLEFIRERLPATKVMFFFHTPYYGVDELLLSQEQKRAAIAEIIACKGDGLPVLNSVAALRAMASGAYERPSRLFAMTDLHGEYVCCRSSGEPQVCANCGYTSCAEVLVARRPEWGAIMTILEAF